MGQGILKCGHSTTGLDSCASWVVWRGPSEAWGSGAPPVRKVGKTWGRGVRSPQLPRGCPGSPGDEEAGKSCLGWNGQMRRLE